MSGVPQRMTLEPIFFSTSGICDRCFRPINTEDDIARWNREPIELDFRDPAWAHDICWTMHALKARPLFNHPCKLKPLR